jgi:hypothetical protein
MKPIMILEDADLGISKVTSELINKGMRGQH